ncbi:LOW QUALITY PROTEIN: uncharacterized protein LOC142827711 [Pelodiscus sinensis]|uniref:LOW QUALITY PROTEIN: uncharacterized protein LOC142827711 n=1 Tax=Pelodiscus sinensis TaxID=13735 RepID=UPI003F6AFE92
MPEKLHLLSACDSGHSLGNGFDWLAKPERRTALVAKELARYDIDIAAPSETCLANEGQLTETGGGYTFFWSGRGTDERRDAGVRFAVRNHLVRQFASLPKGVNDRLMTLQLPLRNRNQATLISAYAPTMTNPNEMKDRFYEELDSLISAVSSTDKLILLSDFNARVGCDSIAWHGVVGGHGVGKCNSNGLLLLKTCAAHDLLITNTMFCLPTRNKTSWMHPCSKHWHLIDYVIVRRKDRQDVRVTKAMCGADCWTDHRLIVSKMNLQIRMKRRPQGSKPIKRVNVAKLKNPSIASALTEDLESRLSDLHLVGSAGHADRNDLKRFYAALNTLYGPQSLRSSPFISTDGTTLITEKAPILQRWAEHFEDVLNRLSFINDEAIERIPQVDINGAMDDPPVVAEVSQAVSQLSSSKAPGADAIPAEVYKAGSHVLTEKLTELFQSFWEQGSIPQELKDASIVHLYKRKGNRQVCDNHRGISLLSIADKILARVMLNRLVTHLECGLLLESQCGFRKGRGTIDMIFAARRLQEKCQEQNRDLYITFVDLTKAFDTVSRQGPWRIMSKFIQMVRQFHDGMMARGLDGGEFSKAFPVTNGVKQGCVLAPTLFSIMFTAMLNDAFQDSVAGISLKYRVDRNLFNLRRLQAITEVKETVLRDFLFADDCALYAGSEAEMQVSVDKFCTACDNFGLTINSRKTEVMYQPVPYAPYTESTITVTGRMLQAVDQFTYLGSTLSHAANIDIEVTCRIVKASSAFGRLRPTVWERQGISQATKLKVYKAVVLTIFLYACETWTVYRRYARQLNHFHMTRLRRILRIRWQDKIPDTEVLSRASLPSVHTLLMSAQTRWAGHVIRMPDERLTKQLLFGELSTGKRLCGGQRKRYKDTLKASLKSFGIDTTTWKLLAHNCPAWLSLIHKGCQALETRHIFEAQQERMLRKSKATAQRLQCLHVCPTCSRTFGVQIGLISHLRTHCIQSQST